MLMPGCSQEAAEKVPITTSSPEALKAYLQARDLSEKLQGQESLEFYQKAVELDPEFAMAHLNMSLAQPSAREFFASLEKAKALVEKVTEGEKLWILGFDAGVNGHQEHQREYYEQLVSLYPEDERALNLLGNHFFGVQDWDAAIAAYKKAILVNPDFSQPYNQLGYAQRFLENYQEAEDAFKRYVELIPDDPNPYDSYAELLLKLGRFEESIEKYRKALEVNPNFVASHVGIATNYNYLEQYEEARKQLDHLLSIARNEGETRAALIAKTVSYAAEGLFQEALTTQDAQFALDAETGDAANMAGDLNLKGLLYLELDAADSAQTVFTRAIEIIEGSDLSDPVKVNNQRNYMYNMGRVHVARGDLDDAKAIAQELLQAAGDAGNTFQVRQAYELKGIIALEERDYTAAIAALGGANQQNPYNLYRIALAYDGLGNLEEAKLMAERAANFNALNLLNQVFIREKAMNFAASL